MKRVNNGMSTAVHLRRMKMELLDKINHGLRMKISQHHFGGLLESLSNSEFNISVRIEKMLRQY